MCNITIEKVGRRFYIRAPFELSNSILRDAGCKYDGERRARWTGKADLAEQLAERCQRASGGPSDAAGAQSSDRKAPGLDAQVAGRATYKGKTFYLAAKVYRRTAWDEDVSLVETRDGSKVLLFSRDGSFQFWAVREVVQIAKTYGRAKTIRSLQEYAQGVRKAGDAESYAEERAEKSGRCRGCGGAIRDAAHHAAMGGYCGSCAFDEFDC